MGFWIEFPGSFAQKEVGLAQGQRSCCQSMFLSVLLFSRRSTPGRQWIGKHRKVKKVTRTQKQTVVERERKVKEVSLLG